MFRSQKKMREKILEVGGSVPNSQYRKWCNELNITIKNSESVKPSYVRGVGGIQNLLF